MVSANLAIANGFKIMVARWIGWDLGAQELWANATIFECFRLKKAEIALAFFYSYVIKQIIHTDNHTIDFQ
jgi:hypothetical protein